MDGRPVTAFTLTDPPNFIRIWCPHCEMRMELSDDEERLLMAEEMNGGMTVDTAVAIINEARTSGVTKAAMPEDDAEKIEFAGRIYKMARQAYASGSTRRDVATIVSLAGDEPPEPQERPAVTGLEKAAEAALEAQEEVPEAPVGAAAQEAIARVKSMGLPIPQPITEADISPVPRDTTMLSDNEVRKLYSQWGAVRNYAGWRLTCEEADFRALTHMVNYQRQVVRQSIPRLDAEGKAKLASVIDAEVETSDEVAPLATQHTALSNSVNALKTLFEIYSGSVERLSREMSFRDLAWRQRHG